MHTVSEQQLLSARELRIDERFVEAMAALDRCEAGDPGVELGRLARAERARLSYYAGAFQDGVSLGSGVAASGADLAAARGALAVSVNLLALNRGHDAHAAARDALLRLRAVRARPDDMVDALIQLAYVEAHLGDHRAGIETARAAVRQTRQDPMADRLRGRALCALGFALTYAGEVDALGVLLEAERAERERGAALWHWAQFCVATFLRDRGYSQPAQVWLARSGVALRYERGWFALRAGDADAVGAWLRLPIAADERPFVRVLVAATRTARGTPGARRTALLAANEFARLGLQHWAWGATWVSATDPALDGAERTTTVSKLVEQLAARGSVHWGFFDPVSVHRLLRSVPASQLSAPAAQIDAHVVSWTSPARYEENALLAALSLLSVDALAAFADLALTPSEIRALVAALQLWLESEDTSRDILADRLGIKQSSVRGVISEIRSKLGIEGQRGVKPIVSWLAERSLLAPDTAMRAVQKLTRLP